MATLGELLGKQTKKEKPFGTTAGGIALETIKGIPEAFADVIGRPALRAYAALGGVITGQKLTPEGQFQKSIYGTNKPITLGSVGSEFGVEEKNPIAPVLGFLAGISDLIPGGKGAKQTYKAIAKSEDAGSIFKELKSLFKNIPEEDLTRAADDLISVKTPKGTQAYLGTFLKSLDEGNKVPKPKTGEILPLIDDVADATKKPSVVAEITPRETKDLVNLRRLSISDKGEEKLLKTLKEMKPELEQVRGRPLTNAEVLKAAQDSSVLKNATSREATLKSEAALLATRQNLTAMAEGRGVTKDFVDQLRIVAAEATRRGRELQALSITADPIANTSKADIVKKLLDIGIEAEDIVKAAEGVDFTSLKDATKFYRSFVKPKLSELIDEYRYINLLSSPNTHIVNAFSNLIQGTLLNPATRLTTGAIDSVLSTLRPGRERQAYMSEVPPYAKGYLNAMPEAAKKFIDALQGNIIIERPDLNRIPTGSKLLKPFQIIPRMLEGTDVFFRTLVTAGEKEALAHRAVKQGKELTDTTLAKIAEKAKETGEYYVFRGRLDANNETGQGHVLSAIDKATSAIYQLRNVPGVKWFIPFIQTPMNILKQGIEYSPLGIATLPGAKNKTEQIAKTLIGSSVFLGAGALALNGRTTWKAPTSEKEKEAFYASGRQPYSVKIGDTWVSYSKLGPLAYPIAMASAVQWYMSENPKAAAQTSMEKVSALINGFAGFFSDQSYMQGLSELLNFTSGESNLSRLAGETTGQLIPLVSLQRWITRVVDPVFRKPDTKADFGETYFQTLIKDIPLASQAVPEIKDSGARPSPLINAFSPLRVSDSNVRGDRDLRRVRLEQRNKARLDAIKERAKQGKGASLGSLVR